MSRLEDVLARGNPITLACMADALRTARGALDQAARYARGEPGGLPVAGTLEATAATLGAIAAAVDRATERAMAGIVDP